MMLMLVATHLMKSQHCVIAVKAYSECVLCMWLKCKAENASCAALEAPQKLIPFVVNQLNQAIACKQDCLSAERRQEPVSLVVMLEDKPESLLAHLSL